jgi:diacylglycerol kinase
MSNKKSNNKDVNEFKNPTFFNAMKNAIRGCSLAIKNERNIKIQIVAAIIATIMGFMFKISSVEWLVLVLTIFFVIVTECLNTAVEKTVDMITNKYSESAKNVKDISAGAVLFSAIASVIVGLIIFLPKILIYIY